MDVHPAAELFPMMPDDQYRELLNDIKTNGLREPIVVYQGKILDGRNRYRACVEAGIEPQFTEYKGESPEYVAVSANLNRRHLSPAQRAMIAARTIDVFRKQAEKTIKHRAGTTKERCEKVRGRKAIELAAKQMGVTPDMVRDAMRGRLGRKRVTTAETDMRKRPLPPELVDVFTEARRFDRIVEKLKELSDAITRLSTDDAGASLFEQCHLIDHSPKMLAIEQAIVAIADSRPWSVCYACYGNDPSSEPCTDRTGCGLRGWMDKKQSRSWRGP